MTSISVNIIHYNICKYHSVVVTYRFLFSISHIIFPFLISYSAFAFRIPHSAFPHLVSSLNNCSRFQFFQALLSHDIHSHKRQCQVTSFITSMSVEKLKFADLLLRQRILNTKTFVWIARSGLRRKNVSRKWFNWLKFTFRDPSELLPLKLGSKFILYLVRFYLSECQPFLFMTKNVIQVKIYDWKSAKIHAW